ncbi:MAG TPA: ABC transporter permease [Trebonia sp.]|jgi:putative ABC transport system permease protein
MISLALSLIRNHKAGLAGVFVAVLFGSAVLTACGIIVDSGLRGGFPPERYAAASVVVGAPESLVIPNDDAEPYSETVPVPGAWVSEIAHVPGVKTAVGDVSVDVSLVTPSGRVLTGTSSQPLLAHGWSSAVLGPFTIAAGAAPRSAGDVVLDTALAARAGARPGDTVEILDGSVPGRFRVTGLASPPPGGLREQSAIFLTAARALQLSGRPDQADTVGVIAQPGVSASTLASRITSAVPGAVTYTGAARADAEFISIGQGRSFLLQAAGGLGGSMALVVMFVVAAALGLSIQQRGREMALLRAIAATPRQIRQMIGTETLLVSATAAVLGAPAGIAVSFLMRDGFASAGTIPANFALAIDPLPPVAAVVICVAVARVAALIAARKATRTSPVRAFGEATRGTEKAGRFRLVAGYLLIPVAIGAAIAVPLINPGQVGQVGAASSALIAMVAVALIGPHWLSAMTAMARPLVSRRDAAGFLSTASVRARAGRLSLAATPLIMAVTLSAVQLFTATTMIAAAQQQARAGLICDFVVTGAGSGVAPGLAGTAGSVPGVSAVTPVARTQVIATFRFTGDPAAQAFSAQGLTPGGLASTMDLDVTAGSMSALTGNTVALSRSAAATLSAGLGQTIHLHLGDGAPITPRVVAIYGNGLGFGDITLPNATVIDHTTSRLDSYLLVRAAPGTSVAAVGGKLRAALAGDPGVAVADRGTFTAAQASSLASQSQASFILDIVLIAYIMIAVVNSLVTATAARAREFAVLALIGATRRQLRAMLRRETTFLVLAAVVIGSLAALPPLIGISAGMTSHFLPDVPLTEYLVIVAAVVALGWGSIMLPARLAMRGRPDGVLNGREG